jgi:hypothetical protein
VNVKANADIVLGSDMIDLLNSWTCSDLYLSTGEDERFIGSGFDPTGQIDNNHDICFYHISDSSIWASVQYNTDSDCDYSFYGNFDSAISLMLHIISRVSDG